MQGGFKGFQGFEGGVQGGSGGLEQLYPGLCAGGLSRTNGSRYPPSVHAVAFPGGFNRLHQLLHGFLPSLKIIFRHELFIVVIEPQLSQPQNVSKGDFPMALLPDPTTAASERSSVKKRLTGSRRCGSGIKNRHTSRTVSKSSLRG